jgi:hypothetical protein
MPWSLAKAKRAAILADQTGKMRADLTRLFDACFRIQREACEAAGRHIPLVVENVRGAQEWVGRARWRYGSFYLWGDLPALMPIAAGGLIKHDCYKTAGMNWSNCELRGQDFTRIAGMQAEGIKCGGTWFHEYRSGQGPRNHRSGSLARKRASALIAKIPLRLSQHIGEVYLP